MEFIAFHFLFLFSLLPFSSLLLSSLQFTCSCPRMLLFFLSLCAFRGSCGRVPSCWKWPSDWTSLALSTFWWCDWLCCPGKDKQATLSGVGSCEVQTNERKKKKKTSVQISQTWSHHSEIKITEITDCWLLVISWTNHEKQLIAVLILHKIV